MQKWSKSKRGMGAINKRKKIKKREIRYSKAYLRHLIISGEILGSQISSIHNLAFYVRLMEKAREKIKEGNFEAWKASTIKRVSERL